jgi:DNA-binding protein H-NS
MSQMLAIVSSLRGEMRFSKMDSELREMSVDELWTLHEQLASLLSSKIVVEKAKLDERHRKISVLGHVVQKRRPYPKVLPKYYNPKNPNETWSGRGKQPRWLTAQLGSGKKITQFLIRRSA